MQNKNILFEGRNELLDPFVEVCGKSYIVSALLNKYTKAPALKYVAFIPIEYKTLGIGTLFKALKIERVTPYYVKGYAKILKNLQPEIIVSLDFFRFSFWQSLRFVKQKSDRKIFIYSETKRWPTSLFSRWSMCFFVWRLRRNVVHIKKILVWTKQGEMFLRQMLPQANIDVVPAGVNIELFHPRESKKFLRDDTLHILCNARYAKYKRHEDLFEAVGRLNEQGKKIKITCIGRADSGRERVEFLAEQYGIGANVTFCDPVPQSELVQLYQAHDLLVLPSYNEAIGMVVPEAMACGIPTVTSDTVGANVYVNDGETGLIYPTGNVEKLAVAIQEISSQKKLEKMSTAARERVVKEYSIDVCQERFIKALGLSCG